MLNSAAEAALVAGLKSPLLPSSRPSPIRAIFFQKRILNLKRVCRSTVCKHSRHRTSLLCSNQSSRTARESSRNASGSCARRSESHQTFVEGLTRERLATIQSYTEGRERNFTTNREQTWRCCCGGRQEWASSGLPCRFGGFDWWQLEKQQNMKTPVSDLPFLNYRAMKFATGFCILSPLIFDDWWCSYCM